MSREDETHAGLVLMAFVMGAITGAAAALVLAPAAGDDTRRVLNEKAREGREQATVAAQQGREFVRRQTENVTAAIDRGREAYQRAREDGQETKEDEG